MKLELLVTIFELFFPNKQYEISIDKNDTLLTCTQKNIKHVVEYDSEENHLQVWEADLNERFIINYIIEGSPEDIIKLSKILQS